MAFNCPECGEVVSQTAASCKHCGVDLTEVAPPPPAPPNDAVKYITIVGIILTVCLVLYFVTTGMTTSQKCNECKGRKVIVCTNCKDGPPRCTGCKGTGKDQGTFSTCGRCNGTGSSARCEACKGEPKKTCKVCGGTGEIPND